MKHSIKGFSLLELMVTLVIFTLLATMAIPSFQGAMRSSRLTSSINELSNSLATARSEAIKQNRSVFVCKKSAAGASTCSTATTGTNWEWGWLVFVDANNDGALNTTCTVFPCDPDTILIDHDVLPTGSKLRSSSTIPSSIRYTSAGRLPDNALTATAYFYLCNPDSGNSGASQPPPGTSRVLIINTIGRTRTAKDANNDGIPELVAPIPPATAVNITTCTP